MRLQLPDGAAAMPEDVQRELQRMDPNLFVRKCVGDTCRNKKCQGWVLARSMENGSVQYLAHRSDPRCTPSIVQLYRDRTSERAPDVVDEVLTHNAALEAQKQVTSENHAEETADRLYSALRRM